MPPFDPDQRKRNGSLMNPLSPWTDYWWRLRVKTCPPMQVVVARPWFHRGHRSKCNVGGLPRLALDPEPSPINKVNAMRSLSLTRQHDGLEQLRGEHHTIRQLLRGFERASAQGRSGDRDKATLVDQLCDTLMLHARVKDEVFYPLLRSILPAAACSCTAFCNHPRLFDLIAWVDELEPDHRDYDRMVRLIGECVLPSMAQEQAVLFQAVRSAGLDTRALGQRMAKCRKAHLRDLTEIIERPSGTEESITAWTASVPLRALAPSPNPF